MLGLLGKKAGMTRIFREDGASVPVTVLDVSGNRVAQVKRPGTDGYAAVQVAQGERKAKRLTKAVAGHLAANRAGPARHLREFRMDESADLSGFAPGESLPANIFEEGQLVDVTGITQGKGFAGVIKRHHFRSNRETHGNSRSTRKPGSIGQRQDPGRVFPGKKMAGHMGAKRRTVQNLSVVRVDEERGLLLVAGAVPGALKGLVMVRPAVKTKKSKAAK
jgi:large subunit ribosomal protein L3